MMRSPTLGRIRVSVVVPAFNEEAVIAGCLNALAAQTLPADEILIIDNGSTDATAEIVHRFQGRCPDLPVRLLSQDAEQGLVPTRNLGFDHAIGDIIGRIDADSRPAQDWVAQLHEAFSDPDLAAVTGPVRYYDLPFRHLGLRIDDLMRRLLVHLVPVRCRFLFGSNMAVRRTAWQVVSTETCPDEHDRMHEDIDLALHLAGHGLQIGYEPTLVAAVSARRLEDSPRDFLQYITRFDRTYAAHDLHKKRLKAPTVFFLAAYFPAKAILKGYEHLRNFTTKMQDAFHKANRP